MTTCAQPRPEEHGTPRPSEAGHRALVGIQTSAPCVMRFGGIPSDPPEPLLQVVNTIAAAKSTGPVVVVVSASGTTTARLAGAVDRALTGDLDSAERIVDGVMDQVTSEGILLVGRFEAALGGRAYRSEATRRIREILAPLRQVLGAVSVLRERTPGTLESVTTFGEQLDAALLVELLEVRGVPAVVVDARGGVKTDHRTGLPRGDAATAWARVREFLVQFPDKVIVVTGFPEDLAEDRVASKDAEGETA